MDLEQQVLDIVVHVIEGAGAFIICVGAAVALFRFVLEGLRHRDPEVFVDVRLGLGRFLALGLEFQLAGDVLKSAISPSFREIGQLAAVAAIRTALNYFLSREVREARLDSDQDRVKRPRRATAATTSST